MKVSLVMGVYNGEEYLRETLDSILAQTYPGLEIIIVNDGSTDRTAEILNDISDARLKVFHLDINKGIANALNLGIEKAEGDWIAIHDADDISLPYRIDKQVAYLRSKPDLIAVGSFIECIGTKDFTQNDMTQIKSLERYKNSIINWEQIKEELFKGCPLTHGSMLISKKAFLEAGKYNPRYKIASDFDFFMRLAALGMVENVPEVLYKYRISPHSLSNSNVYQTSDEFLLAVTKYIRIYCFKQKVNVPKVIVYGTREGCKRFKELMQVEKNLSVQGAIENYNTEEIMKAYKYFKQGRIDAVIILSNESDQYKVVKNLKIKGLEQNKDFFTLWSAL